VYRLSRGVGFLRRSLKTLLSVLVIKEFDFIDMKSCQIAGWMPKDEESPPKVLMIKTNDSNEI
jgi:hypothetical protein